MHLQSRRLALSGMLCALAMVFLLAGGLIPTAVYACPLLAIVTLIPVREECGTRLSLAAYGATAILALMLCPDKEMAGVYLALGWYPAAQPYLDHIHPALLQWSVKLSLFAAAVTGLYASLIFLFGFAALAEEFSEFSRWFLGLLVILGCATFLLADLLLRKTAAVWNRRLRRKWFS